VSSLLCGLAWSTPVLIGARVLQGASAAAMSPQVVTLIQLTFEGRARARALAWWATVISLGVVVGQVAGGALVSANVAGTSWRPIFLVNIPIGVAALLCGGRVLPDARAEAPRRPDLAGVALLSACVALLIVPLAFGRAAHWAAWVWLLLAAGLAAGVAALWHMGRLQRRGGDPVSDLSLFRHLPLALGLAAVCGMSVAYGGFLFTLTLHLQGELGFSAVRSGLTFSPYALGFAVVSLSVPRLRPARASVAILSGLAVMALAYGATALFARDG